MVSKPLEIHSMMWNIKGKNFKPIQKAGLGKVKIYYNTWSKDYEQILIKQNVVSIYPYRLNKRVYTKLCQATIKVV